MTIPVYPSVGFTCAQDALHAFEAIDRLVTTLTALGWTTDEEIRVVGVDDHDRPYRTTLTAYDWAGADIASATLHARTIADVLTPVARFEPTITEPSPDDPEDVVALIGGPEGSDPTDRSRMVTDGLTLADAIRMGHWLIWMPAVRDVDVAAEQRRCAHRMLISLMADGVATGDIASFEI